MPYGKIATTTTKNNLPSFKLTFSVSTPGSIFTCSVRTPTKDVSETKKSQVKKSWSLEPSKLLIVGLQFEPYLTNGSKHFVS